MPRVSLKKITKISEIISNTIGAIAGLINLCWIWYKDANKLPETLKIIAGITILNIFDVDWIWSKSKPGDISWTIWLGIIKLNDTINTKKKRMKQKTMLTKSDRAFLFSDFKISTTFGKKITPNEPIKTEEI